MTQLTKRIIIGVIAMALIALMALGAILVGAGFYGWRAAQRAGNEAATMQNVKTIAAVEIQYYNTHNRTFGTFDQMIKEELLTAKFSGNPPAADGYIFTLSVTTETSRRPASYALNADPQNAATGRNHFYIDSSDSTIHVNPNQPAGATDP
jgi:hypothetical protein